ncbi:MAG: Ureidoglycolate lyase [Peltula sp. TS41687]|nr:MAG: Ureidoglycolate lyase [Peltula sp. TS41687]
MAMKPGIIRLHLKPLNQADFTPFGTVIQNPSPGKLIQQSVSTAQSHNIKTTSPSPEVVNQGTALKFSNVTEMVNLYTQAPSRKGGRAVMNMFICTPRSLIPDDEEKAPGGEKCLLSLNILERHPFTTQTFIPLGLTPLEHTTRYLVIVAPSLPPSPRKQRVRPPPFPKAQPRSRRRSISDVLPPPFPENDSKAVNVDAAAASKQSRLPASGLPDLQNLRAFVADGSQAVTYGAGVWHAPMVVLGTEPVEFVVVQYANGVAREDCQEVEVDQRVFVVVPSSDGSVELDQPPLKAKL